jgi:general secretion pathway protein G
VRWQRRLTRLEAGICAALVAAVLAVFLERALYYLELAERTVMMLTVTNLNSALNVRRAYGMLGAQPMDDQLRNPFELAGMSPVNVLGEIDSPSLATLERGQWVFDRTRNELIYLPRLRRGLVIADPEGAIHFKLERRSHGMAMLAPTSEYSWD